MCKYHTLYRVLCTIMRSGGDSLEPSRQFHTVNITDVRSFLHTFQGIYGLNREFKPHQIRSALFFDCSIIEIFSLNKLCFFKIRPHGCSNATSRPSRTYSEYYHVVLYGENTPTDIPVGFGFAAKLSRGHHRSISLSCYYASASNGASSLSLTCFDAPLRCALNKPNISLFPFCFSYFLFPLDKLHNL